MGRYGAGMGGGGGYPERRQHGQLAQGWGLGQAISREWRRPGLSL